MTLERLSPIDFDADQIEHQITIEQERRSVLRFNQVLAIIALVAISSTVITGKLPLFPICISILALIYGLHASRKPIRIGDTSIAKLKIKRARCQDLNRYCLRFDHSMCKYRSSDLTKWMEANCVGGAMAVDLNNKSYIVSFPDEDTKMLFRLAVL